jgi:GNAT superfamily N-acetyltransferase
MSLEVRHVQTRRDLRRFISLPGKIHASHRGWVPPFYADDRRTFDPRRNLAHRYCDSILALAFDGEEIVGRVAGIINHRYNSAWSLKHARFGYLETIERKEVTAALLRHVETWARERGMEKLVGPMGFTEEDPEGFLFEGFEHPPNLATYYNFPFVNGFLEDLGFAKEVDYVVYQVPLATAISEFYQRAHERVMRRKDIALKEFRTKKELRPYIRPMFQLMNQCFAKIYGYSPLDDVEMDNLANRYLPIVDPRFIKVVITSSDTLVGFLIGMPNMADGIRASRGRLTPLGLIRILSARRHSRKLDLYLGGIAEEYRGRGVDVLMGFSIIASAQQAGFTYLDSHHELETNTKVRAEMEAIGGKVYKRFRTYSRKLT